MSNPLDQPSIDTPQSSSTPTQAEPTPSHQRLAIEGSSSSSAITPTKEDEEVHTLDLGEGNVIKLDKLGPMIINSDGTLSRIQNWQDLHPIEQERTVRLLVKKRNFVRLQKLDAENKTEDNREGQLSALKAGSEESR
ncbi:hypothetical protein CI109_106382 [Kwoniella shandongensis]|uniref:Uncharacterized protein n=1 Tax=Kwoniella shandongensis TaxID=1734106 RepID=A0A5M6BS67_9TREE|nr:uncharacterized protein CI109_005911 [Kwoniella shandongensis]KAA5525748.1 hypothetical protein CI109_005911 [Kwoniella shandongensis]